MDSGQCAELSSFTRTGAQPARHSLAWTYYQAVSIFGSLASVDAADVEAAAALV